MVTRRGIFLSLALALVSVLVVACAVYAGGTKCNDFTFDGTRSSAMNNQKLQYHWDFGDGITSDLPVTSHHYDKAGEYTVRLTVTDESGLPCDTGVTTQIVKVNTPPKAEFNGPDTICVGDQVTFDASATKSDSAKNLSYIWTFGDGTSGDGVRVNKTYEKGGNYRVQLIVDDNQGTQCSDDCAYLMVNVNTSPVAEAGEDIEMTCVPAGSAFKVNLRGSGSDADGDKLTYNWNLGDGSTAEGASVSHTYENSGTYKATLTVDDGKESQCSMASDMVNIVLSRAPRADAGKDIAECLGSEISFDGSGSVADGGQYTWDFGDGSTGTGVKTSHRYEKGGTYRAILTVSNGDCKSQDSVLVTLNSSPDASLTGPELVCMGSRALFDASGSKDPEGDRLSYTWDFGDGELVKGSATECRVYEKCGTYQVKVTVDDGKGTPCSTDQAVTAIRVNCRPAAVIAPTDACCVGVESMFDGSQSSDPEGDKLSYAWDFGDGTTATGAKVSHVYKEVGTYKVVLTVDDNVGTECSSSIAVMHLNIHENPNAVINVR